MVSNCYALWLWHGIQHKKGHSWNWGTQMIQFLVSDAFKERSWSKGGNVRLKRGHFTWNTPGRALSPHQLITHRRTRQGYLSFQQEEPIFLPQEEEDFFLTRNSSVNRKSSPPWILFLPMYFYSEEPLPTSSFFLYNVPLLCFLDLPMVLP